MITRLFALIFALLWLPLAAFYVGNSADPKSIEEGVLTSPDDPVSIKFALIDDWTNGKELQVVNGSDVSGYSRNGTGVSVNLDIRHRLNIYAYFMSNATSFSFKGIQNQPLYVQVKNSYAYVVEGQLIIFDSQNFTFSTWAQCMSEVDRLGILKNNGVRVPIPNNTRLHSWEAQGGVQLGYTLNFLIPYIGWYYTYYSSRLSNLPPAFSPTPQVQFINPQKNGVVLGLTISSHKYFSFNVEARLLAETAVGTDLSIKF